MRRVRLTWTIGGIGLVLAGVIAVLPYLRLNVGPVVFDIFDVVFGVTVIFLAIGLSKDASVVARRPLGMIALAVLALLPCAVRFVNPYLPEMNNQTEDELTAFMFGRLALSYVAALVGSFQIARAGTVPTSWRWAPWWAAIFSVAALVLRMFLLSGSPFGAASVYLGALDLLVRTLGLGILALVIASRLRNRSVEVAPSSPLS